MRDAEANFAHDLSDAAAVEHANEIPVDDSENGNSDDEDLLEVRDSEANFAHDLSDAAAVEHANMVAEYDEESIAEVCRELLEYQGYTVTSITSSTEALDLFKENPKSFDLVFTDQTMPEMSGVELAAELLKIRPDIPIVLCSGYSGVVSEVDAKKAGIHEFCMKPMDMEQLALVARKVLDENAKHK